MVIKKYLHDKIGTPLMNLLSQGVSPEKLSISIACGAVIGLFPVLGATTLICAAIAIALRLNLVAIQLSNYLVYPLQIALLIPFVRFGAFICQADPPPLSAQELTLLFQQNFWGTIGSFLGAIVYAAIAWFLVCVSLLPVLYFAFVPIVRKFKHAHAGITR